MKTKGFTLIELLIAIAIIGILASILMPALAKARKKSYVAVCINNHKQLSAAYQMYTDDNSGLVIYHKWYHDYAGIKGNKSWGNHKPEDRPLNRYLDDFTGTSKVAKCPSDIGQSWAAGGFRTEKTNYWLYGSSYVVKYATTMNIDKFTNVQGGKILIDGFAYPSSKALFYQKSLNNGRIWGMKQIRWHDDNQPKFPLGFADGHVLYINFSWKKHSMNAPNVGGGIEGRIAAYGYY
jgi:prepilin-type N-terminal cleavage/methylation domain-containing protein